jgi:hypothetical protein
MKKLLIVCALVAAPLAHADFMDGNKLHDQLKDRSDLMYISAQGYIAGIYDATNLGGHCAPPQVTLGQLVDVVKAHLESHPETRHFTGYGLVLVSLNKAFPCPKKPTSGRLEGARPANPTGIIEGFRPL